jgi:hypothetical protein
MFRMTASVSIGNFKPVKPNSLRWTTSVDNYSDSAVVKLPAITRIKKEGDQYDRVQTGLQFKEGDKVLIYAGYDGSNELRFSGFIRRINFTIPVELECEGYSYLLRKKTFTRSYTKGWKLKKLLTDLTEGTAIKLSKSIPDIIVQTNVQFKNSTGTDVLEWIKDKMLLTSYFSFDTLYVGLRETDVTGNAKFRLNWNTVQDRDLKFSTDKEFAQVKFVLDEPRDKDGSRKKAVKDSKYTDTQVKKVGVRYDQSFLDKLAADEKKKLVNRGYEGSFTAFLVPFVKPGMSVTIDDNKYPERTGKFFTDAVEGEFSESGGRQVIRIGNVL